MGDSMDWNKAAHAAGGGDASVELLLRRPRNRTTAATHRRWTARVTDAIRRLDIEKRARWARDNRRKYQAYSAESSGTNEISRKLERKCRATVSGLPTATARFVEEDDEAAWKNALEAFAAHQMRQQHVARTLKSLLWDNYVAGIGWARIDWESRFSAGTPTDPATAQRDAIAEGQRIESEWQQLLAGILPSVHPADQHELHIERHETHREAIAQLAEQAAGGPWQANVQLVSDLLDVHLSDHRFSRQRVDSEVARFSRQPPHTVYYDPDAADWESVEWYAVEQLERLEVLKLNPELSRGALARIEGQPQLKRDADHMGRRSGPGAGGSDATPEGEPDTSPAERWVRYYIIHDLIDREMIVVAEQETSEQLPLLVTAWPYPGRIVEPLVLNPVDEQVHGVSECRRLERVHRRLEEVDERIDVYITSVPAAKVVMPGSVAKDAAFAKAFADPRKILVASGPNGEDDLKNKIWEYKFPGVDVELLRKRQELSAELDSIAGVSDLAQLESTNETATATAVKDRAMSNVIEEDQHRVSELMAWWLRSLIDLWRELGTIAQFVAITGDDGKDFRRFLPASIPENMWWEVDADSFNPSQRELEQKREIDLLGTIAQWIDPTPVLAARPILARLFRKFGAPEDVSNLFIDPAEQAAALAAMAIQAQPPMGAGGPGSGANGRTPAGAGDPMAEQQTGMPMEQPATATYAEAGAGGPAAGTATY